SIMPTYAHLLANDLDYSVIQRRVDAMAMLGVPYGAAVRDGVAARMAHDQAKLMADSIAQQGGPRGLDRKEIIALTAYLQRLGRDIKLATSPATVARASAGGGSAQ
ncbi:MAG TPA: cbb3-type cytochrome c oxidase subunit II, partial [Gemmatimonadaceae bacterium]